MKEDIISDTQPTAEVNKSKNKSWMDMLDLNWVQLRWPSSSDFRHSLW